MNRETITKPEPAPAPGPPGARLSATSMFFNTLQEVNLFIWTWIWNLTGTFFQLTYAIEQSVAREFLLDAQWFGELFAFTRPWQSQVILYLGKQWDLFVARIPKAVKDGFTKLNTLREDGHRKTISATRDVLRTLDYDLRYLAVPVIDSCRSLIASLFAVRAADTFSAQQGATELLDIEQKTDSATHQVEGWTAEIAEMLNNLITTDGLLQMRTWLWSQDRFFDAGANLAVNRLISTDPEEEYKRLSEKYPVRTSLDRFQEVFTLEVLDDPRIDDAIALFVERANWKPEGA